MAERISRRTVRRWLKEWDFIVCDGPPKEDIHGNSGSRPIDGVTAKRLNKIMLEQAYAALPFRLRVVAYYRWVRPHSLKSTLEILGFTKDQYYYRCDKVIAYVYHYVNGDKDCLEDVV